MNSARAGIVDRDALVAALSAGWIAGAAVDVFDQEPLRPEDVLRSLPNLLATPHLGYVAWRSYEHFYGEAAEDIRALSGG